MLFAKRFLGLLSFGGAALWELRWEAIRGVLYERGWVLLTEYMDGAALHYAIPGILVVVGLGLFIWTRSANNPLPKQAAPSTSDWSIREVFSHIRPDYPLTSVKTVGVATTDNLDSRWKPVGDCIIKQLSTGKLHAIGRKEVYNPIRHLAHAPIPQAYWQTAKFTFYFLDQDGKDQDHVVNDDGVRYSDLEVNRTEALAIWPKEPWPDFKKWDTKTNFELYEAACLWFNIEPRLPMPDRALSKYQSWKYMAFGGGLPVHTDSVRHAVQIGMNKDSSITPHTLVHRVVLEGLAEHDGYEPLFLYPHRRGEK